MTTETLIIYVYSLKIEKNLVFKCSKISNETTNEIVGSSTQLTKVFLNCSKLLVFNVLDDFDYAFYT